MPEELTTAGSAGAARQHRTRKVVVSVVAALLVLAVGAGAAYLALLNHTVTANVKHEALLPRPGVTLAPGETVPDKAPSAKDAENILLIGSDSRGKVANGRSDVIVLMHISSDRKSVYLVHFPRDMYVDVPGHGKDKINAAYAYGGSQLLVRTLQKLVDVPLDHVAVIGFDGFKAMTDAMGGVDVYAEEVSTEPGTGSVHVGLNHLDGTAALAFVRERHQLSEGDISRGRRQQAFIKALMLKALSKQTLGNPVSFAQFVDAGTRNLAVDNAFSISDMRSQALGMRSLRSKDIVFITAPITGFGTSPIGASIDIVDETQMAQLSFALRNDDMSAISLGRQVP
ncbi:MAG: LCP family protein [Phycicoccus sp.]|nr:LCP family protein [Phycicoccus sp.]NMM34903.1 LCP family protein [Phycicoccus sp.]